MDSTAQITSLTKREFEIAELLAWGAAKKEIPDMLSVKPGRRPISVRTVEVLTKSIYEKLQIQKVSELAVWYFCTRFHISMDLSPIKRRMITTGLLILILIAEACNSSDFIRTRAVGRSLRLNCRIRQGASGKKSENTYEL
jgi:DNA-binding CsgD family transcriptional regulator